jgi:hypothetical protein
MNGTGTIFIKVDAPLPATLSIESEAFLPGWRVKASLDSDERQRHGEMAVRQYTALISSS